MKFKTIITFFCLFTLMATNALAGDSTSYSPANVTPKSMPGVPIGGVIPWTSTQVPDGFLECNGQYISSGTYPDLVARIGTRVPDLRGEFIRGWDHGRGADSGRGLRSTQQDVFQGHTFGGGAGRLAYNTNRETSLGDNVISYPGHEIGTFWAGASPPAGSTSYAHIVPDGYGAPRLGWETRPRNVALMYIIRAK